jgi:putative glutamine amidotransferase
MDPVLAVSALDEVSGLVLTGGEDMAPGLFGEAPHPATGEPHAARDAYELALARAAAERRMPTLAICRGVQILNVALGGTLVQDIPTQRPGSLAHEAESKAQRGERVHHVALDPESRLARIVGSTSITTNSSHHQSLNTVPAALHVIGRADDGIVEAVEPRDQSWWMLGLQWHPEELTATAEDWDRRLFAAFADAVRAGVSGLRSSAASAPRHEPAASAARASAPPGRIANRSPR